MANKPLHTNHCNHPLENFIESYAGADIYIYDSVANGSSYYCVRHSSEGHDYTSIIRTLEKAREVARIREESQQCVSHSTKT